jgi:hypothetical protein
MCVGLNAHHLLHACLQVSNGVLGHRLLLTQILSSPSIFSPHDPWQVLGATIVNAHCRLRRKTDCFREEYFDFVILTTKDPFSPKRLLEKFGEVWTISRRPRACRDAPAGRQLRLLPLAVNVLFEGQG